MEQQPSTAQTTPQPLSLSEAYAPAFDAIDKIIDFAIEQRQRAFDSVIELCQQRLAELNSRGPN